MVFSKFYSKLIAFGNHLQSPLLLLIRLFWGGSFLLTGWGKFEHLEQVSQYFHSLGIPFPFFNAMLTALIETVCGTCLLLGFASRLITIPLIFTMITAILTAEKAALGQILSDPQKLIHTDPFSFLFASLIIFVFGPGAVSIDRCFFERSKPTP
jgi:putative oxidoreductase